MVAYERPEALDIMIKCFRLQTNANWEMHICYDGPAPDSILNIIRPMISGEKYDHRIHFYESPERYGKYGHPNRRTMLQSLKCDFRDFILMTNDDNYYVPRFVEFMLKEAGQRVGLVYCDTIHSHFQYDLHKSELKENYIDLGAFIVRADMARATGFNYEHFSADGVYAEQCKLTCQHKGLKIVKINKPLFIHN